MHLAISMFLLVATGSAVPPPHLICQNRYQSGSAVARGLAALMGGGGGKWVWGRAVSAFLSSLEFHLFGVTTFLRRKSRS